MTVPFLRTGESEELRGAALHLQRHVYLPRIACFAHSLPYSAPLRSVTRQHRPAFRTKKPQKTGLNRPDAAPWAIAVCMAQTLVSAKAEPIQRKEDFA